MELKEGFDSISEIYDDEKAIIDNAWDETIGLLKSSAKKILVDQLENNDDMFQDFDEAVFQALFSKYHKIFLGKMNKLLPENCSFDFLETWDTNFEDDNPVVWRRKNIDPLEIDIWLGIDDLYPRLRTSLWEMWENFKNCYGINDEYGKKNAIELRNGLQKLIEKIDNDLKKAE